MLHIVFSKTLLFMNTHECLVLRKFVCLFVSDPSWMRHVADNSFLWLSLVLLCFKVNIIRVTTIRKLSLTVERFQYMRQLRSLVARGKECNCFRVL